MNRLYFICVAFFGLIFLFSLGEADSMPSMKLERRSVKKSIHRVTKRHSRFLTGISYNPEQLSNFKDYLYYGLITI